MVLVAMARLEVEVAVMEVTQCRVGVEIAVSLPVVPLERAE